MPFETFSHEHVDGMLREEITSERDIQRQGAGETGKAGTHTVRAPAFLPYTPI